MRLTPGERKALFLLFALLSFGGALKAHQIHETRWGQAFLGPPPLPLPASRLPSQAQHWSDMAAASRLKAALRGEPSILRMADSAPTPLVSAASENGSREVPTHHGPSLHGKTKATGKCPVNLNLGDQNALSGLPGVGEKTAAAILAYRRQHGPFQKAEDLLSVKGIGQKKLDRMRSCLIL